MNYSARISKIQDLLREISSSIVSLSSNNSYESEKQKIVRIFKSTSGSNYNRDGIELRLIVIDSLYSTNMTKRYFAFDELSSEIYSLGTKEKEVIKKIQNFRNDPFSEKDIVGMFDGKEYGIHKNGESAGEAKSLLSKYFYFQLMMDPKDKVGFPIYDSMAKSMYHPVCNYIGLLGKPKFRANYNVDIAKFLSLLKELALKLDLCGQYNMQDFDILDAYLWRMGKFSEGNFSLLLNKKDYLKLIKAYGLSGYKKGRSGPEVNDILKDNMLLGYKKILNNAGFNRLWKHWLELVEK